LQAAPSRRRTVAIALSVSLAAHLIAGAAIILSSTDRDNDEELDPFSVVDVEVAPEAPEGFDPADQPATAQLVEPAPVAPPAEKDDPDETRLEPDEDKAEPKDDDGEDKTAEATRPDAGPHDDAGPLDAGTAVATASGLDGGPPGSPPSDAGVTGTDPL